jgi:DNA replication protein DnaC
MHRLKTLTYPSILVIDETGYLPVSKTGAMLFLHLINRRYERASTVLTSNKGFEEWWQIRGNTYPTRHHTDLPKVLHPAPAAPSSPPPRRRRSKTKENTTT